MMMEMSWTWIWRASLKPLISYCSKYPKQKAIKEEDDTMTENETNGEQSTKKVATDTITPAKKYNRKAVENNDTAPDK